MTERDELLLALDAGLAALEHGASLESVLAGYPGLAAELRPLLLAAQSVGAGGDLARVPAGAQAASRSQFLARAADRRAAVVPVAGRGWWARLRSRLAARPLAGGGLLARAVVTGLVVLAGLGAGGYGAVAASAQSLPGDALYGVKRTVERTELLLAPDEQARARLQGEFDDRRVREAQAVAAQGRQVPVEFTGTLISMNGAQAQHWLVSGIAVLVGPQVPVDGQPFAGAQVYVQGTIQTVGEVQAQYIKVLPPRAGPTDATPNATPTASVTAPAAATATAAATEVDTTAATATATLTPIPTPAAGSATTAPTVAAPVASPVPSPTATQVATATEDHGGGPSPSRTPEATEGGDHGGGPSETPAATEGGGSTSETPEPTEGGDHGGPSPSNTPQPTNSGGGASPSNTPKPDD